LTATIISARYGYNNAYRVHSLFPDADVQAHEPSFIGQLQNITVIRGKEAVFHCAVDSLNGYRVSEEVVQ
jgi:hypothetical protein